MKTKKSAYKSSYKAGMIVRCMELDSKKYTIVGIIEEVTQSFEDRCLEDIKINGFWIIGVCPISGRSLAEQWTKPTEAVIA